MRGVVRNVPKQVNAGMPVYEADEHAASAELGKLNEMLFFFKISTVGILNSQDHMKLVYMPVSKIYSTYYLHAALRHNKDMDAAKCKLQTYWPNRVPEKEHSTVLPFVPSAHVSYFRTCERREFL